MYEQNDFNHFAITAHLPATRQDCPEDCQIVEFLTVANYDYFKQLRLSDRKAYNQKRNPRLHMLEKHYVPILENTQSSRLLVVYQ